MREWILYVLGIPVMFFVFPALFRSYGVLRLWLRALLAFCWPIASLAILGFLGVLCLRSIYREFNNRLD